MGSGEEDQSFSMQFVGEIFKENSSEVNNLEKNFSEKGETVKNPVVFICARPCKSYLKPRGFKEVFLGIAIGH
jgi:hypothetical protein